ncbi:hypothetical protein JN403_17275 [Pseudomonas sp. 15A4]|uniref:hypothetical protein n=1 Tax=Pseudomonas sp. 15A4 TaxID=2804761 RepID=UPI0019688CDA|nr:hypothetical protein [Pseudomonas sp. 15A4]QSB18294.1 hypothetical protein JN403_17275 [Pseudomonas sp. 15A4]
MREIAELLVDESPTDAAGWLLFIQVLANENPGLMEDYVAKLPVSLSGTASELLKLANVELSLGLLESGLDRVYRTMRLHSGDVDAAAGHVSLMVMATNTSEGIQALPLLLRSAPLRSSKTALARPVTSRSTSTQSYHQRRRVSSSPRIHRGHLRCLV